MCSSFLFDTIILALVSKPVVVANNWDDEDDDDVKDNWDDEDEEVSTKSDAPAEPTPTPGVAVKKKKGKALKEKIAQKEQESKPKTTEELLAEKLERQRLVEESDLNAALDTFGVSSGEDASVLSNIRLASKKDFEDFQKALNEKLSPYIRSPHYITFLEELFRNLSAPLEVDDIKKLDSVLTSLFNEKIKAQKVCRLTGFYCCLNFFSCFSQQIGKKKVKKNAEVKVERDHDYSYDRNDDYNQYDDFF